MFYFLGSLLFASAMLAAFTVMAGTFARYRRAMTVALRSLSLDGFGDAPRGLTLPAAALPAARRRAAA